MLATAAGQHREWGQSSASCVKLVARPNRSATLSRVRINLRPPFPSLSRPNCDRSRLADLLADRLPAEELPTLTAHLEHCDACRQHLESLAGDGAEWGDVREALSTGEASEAPTPEPAWEVAGSSEPEVFHREAGWVRSLLQPCEESELGRLGRYPVRGVIGQGGMGVVLSGWDTELNRPLALKLLAPHLASSGAARQRFLREAQAAAAVVHPNVVPIYAIHADAPLPYLVMPYISGGNLQQRLDSAGPMELEDCLRTGLQIAEGLAAAHRQGLVHRDIKPANILLEEGGHRILISDFGLARALDDVSMTASGVIAGTPPYMSPEQARGEAAHYPSDLFSLGSVLYAMATGRPPFRGESSLAILRQIGQQRVTPIRELNERMPAWLDRLLARLMHKHAPERPASAQRVVALLQGCLAHVRSPAAEALPPELRASRRITRRAVGLAIAAAMVATIVGVPVVGSWLRTSKPDINLTPTHRAIADPAANPDTPATTAPQPALPPRPSPILLYPPDSIDRQIIRIEQELQQLQRAIAEDLGHPTNEDFDVD